ncbi:MAG: SDR family NAD(P)-dependent oxidoreductase [Ilumatobacter sp.]|uniref:SDR family NAD(P)-dependent oxidoreductase n=1 Tax=Ilumatobacter sp. TaxID=1967498 RepID=UPI00329848A8
MIDTAGRTIMISGANRGLGNAIARRLHGDGFTVSVGARDVDALTDAMAGCDTDRLLCHHYDALDAGSDRAWVDATIGRFGRLDGIVNNAGIVDTASLEDLSADAVDTLLAVNVKAPLRMTQLTLPHLRASGSGRVVNIASLSGIRVKGTFAPGYAMSKHAVMALTEATKQAGWDDGVRVTAVCPGYIATDMTADFGEDPTTMIDPADLAELVSTTISLPNTASVAQLNVACRLEPHV